MKLGKNLIGLLLVSVLVFGVLTGCSWGSTIPARIKTFKPDSGSLTPDFSATVYLYNLEIASYTTLIDFKIETVLETAEVIVSDENNNIVTLPFLVPSDLFKLSFKVSAQGSTAMTYIVTINRLEGTDVEDPVDPEGPSSILDLAILAGVKISEVGSSTHSQSARWFEVHNGTENDIDLSDFQVKAQCLTVSTVTPVDSFIVFDLAIDSTDVDYSKYSEAVKSLELKAGQYAVLQVRPLEGSGVNKNEDPFTSISIPSGPNHYYIKENSGYSIFWDANGSLELLYKGKTADFVRFGSNSQTPETVSEWGGGAAILGATFASDIGKSIARDISNSDTNNSSDWYSRDWATPGGLNDVLTTLDADGDGIPDANEVAGKTFAGLDLHSWGARAGQTDFFIHLDYMNSADEGVTPRKEALDKVSAAFYKAGTNFHPTTFGNFPMKVHFDCGSGTIPGDSDVDYNLDGRSHLVPDALSTSLGSKDGIASDLYYYKATYMPMAKKNIFHYLLFANSQNVGGGSGSSGIAECPGNDFMVTLNSWGLSSINVGDKTSTQKVYEIINKQAATIMHEFGHNLGLYHGGTEDQPNYKPNYVSIMNYLYQMRGLSDISESTLNITGDRYYYMQGRILYSDDDKLHWNCFSDKFIIDYSNKSLPDLNEAHLNELVGIGNNVAINFDGNLSSSAGDISYDTNDYSTYDGGGLSILTDHDDWAAIQPIFQREYWSDAHGTSSRSFDECIIEPFNPLYNDIQPHSSCQ